MTYWGSIFVDMPSLIPINTLYSAIFLVEMEQNQQYINYKNLFRAK